MTWTPGDMQTGLDKRAWLGWKAAQFTREQEARASQGSETDEAEFQGQKQAGQRSRTTRAAVCQRKATPRVGRWGTTGEYRMRRQKTIWQRIKVTL